MKRLLVQTQLSNINYQHNQFDLACDSGWQMVMGRVREMLALQPDLDVSIMCPMTELTSTNGMSSVVDNPWNVNTDLWDCYGSGRGGKKRLRFIEHEVVLNALATRLDFKWSDVATDLDLQAHKADSKFRWDAVYVNDPFQLRNLKALFHVVGGYQPQFYVHNHFVDVPEVPKFPTECSLWLGQCESAIRADHNFWQCESAMQQFFESMSRWFTPGIVDDVRSKSTPSDDGYSAAEIQRPIDASNLTFSEQRWHDLTRDKCVLFFPNRISPSSNDYTNGMKFMFDVLPRLWARRNNDFVVVCGNPNQKFTNAELAKSCGKYGYVKLTEDTFNRDEYRFVGARADIALGLYNADAYGGTAARELVELGCVPQWLDNYEYSSLAREAGVEAEVLAKPDLSDLVDALDRAIQRAHDDKERCRWINSRLRSVVRQRCSYESTVPEMMRKMKLL